MQKYARCSIVTELLAKVTLFSIQMIYDYGQSLGKSFLGLNQSRILRLKGF